MENIVARSEDDRNYYEKDEEEEDDDEVTDPDYVPPRRMNDSEYLPYSPHSPRHVPSINTFLEDN